MAAQQDPNDVHIETGKIWPSKKSVASWNLHKGSGDRMYTEHVNFHKSFTSQPVVVVMISAQDVMTDADHRISTTATSIGNNGFDINISTWGDTVIWGACISWFAYDKSLEAAQDTQILGGCVTMRKTIPGFGLHKGSGDRNYLHHIDFSKNFSVPPNVFVAIAMLDVMNEPDHRINVFANNIKANGFDVSVGTWSDTKIWGCAVSWIAFDKSFSDSPRDGVKLFHGRQPFKKGGADFHLYDGSGNRFNKRRLNFPRKFSGPPSVLVALGQLDVMREHDHRINSCAENVDVSGFDLKVNTWSDSQVWSASPVWLAVGKIQSSANNNNSNNNSNNNNNNSPTTTTTASNNSNNNNNNNDNSNNNNNSEPPSKKAKTSTTGDQDKEEDKECKVCFDNPINTVLIPCGHLCVCEDCSKLLTKNKWNAQCPICKQKIQSVVKTFVA